MKFSVCLLVAALRMSWGFPTLSLVRNHNQILDMVSSSSSADSSPKKVSQASDAFLTNYFTSECDDFNLPPSLSIMTRSFSQLLSGSDIRGSFVDHPRLGGISAIAQAISKSSLPALTPFAAHCLGYAFGTMIKDAYREAQGGEEGEVVVCVGRDPRAHGTVLADAFGRGAAGVDNVRVVYTGIATTPAMFEFCR